LVSNLRRREGGGRLIRSLIISVLRFSIRALPNISREVARNHMKSQWRIEFSLCAPAHRAPPQAPVVFYAMVAAAWKCASLEAREYQLSLVRHEREK
jgi:hypothetical protein